MVNSSALVIDDLFKSYGSVEVLKNISLSIEQGDFLVLVGPSGCGKSTLLNCIAGLEETTSGRIDIAGRDVTNEPPRDRDICGPWRYRVPHPRQQKFCLHQIRQKRLRGYRPQNNHRLSSAEIAPLSLIIFGTMPLVVWPALNLRQSGRGLSEPRHHSSLPLPVLVPPSLILFSSPLQFLRRRCRLQR